MRVSGRAAVSVGAIVLLLSACSADPAPVPSQTVVPNGTPEPGVSAPDVSEEPFHGPSAVGPASIATATDASVDVYDMADGDRERTVDAADVLTAPGATPLTFLVKEDAGDWLEVYLPIRPNGSTGWIERDEVTVAQTDFRVEVSLVDFELTVWKGGDDVLTTSIGVGRDDRPTPGGVYYIRELLQPPNPGGVYGPYAYGLSGYSPVLDEFNGGEAIIGMHGTNEPDSIGHYVSSGCIRMPNATITQLVTEVGLPLGTPVLISEAASPLANRTDGEAPADD